MKLDKHLVTLAIAKISEEVEKQVPYINRGGCGVFTYELASRLKAVGAKGVKVRVYAYYEDRKVNVSKVEQYLNTDPYANPKYRDYWNDNGVVFCHLKLEWNKLSWDAEGCEPTKEARTWAENSFFRQPGHISTDSLKKLLAVPSNWNRTFDRKNIPKVRRIMDKHFKALLKKMS